ncbi:zonular occludens toxin domain-containing protein [Xanthomonas sp. BRIP62411]|uniref:zonular occludens toxin domain-containing protein n=1 Tax=Xanthomonas sp. BRIP62411 TaxID=2182389 RepID=UPI000F8EDB02|nr:zonular occludens toxin domain-containing protein [Xanthomonas sp. BRIP62411]
MGLYLVTGQPGHGKTAYALDKAFQFKKEGRTIYAHGVKDLDYEKAGFKHIEDPTQWEALPDGSVVLLDECYTVFPNRNPGAKVPAHVDAMARHRHRGFDFILIAQQGLQLDPFLRGLYEEHCHVRQTSIFKSKTKLKRWTQYQSNVQGHCSDVRDWVRPKYVFDYYTSTTMVTTKRSVPMWIRWIGVGLIVLVVVMYGLKWNYDRRNAEFESERTSTNGRASPTALGRSSGAGGAARTYETPTDYAKAHVARFATMPWTAPIYDGGSPAGQPQLYCMSSLAGTDAHGNHRDASCSCMTEQGTKYEISQPECRTVARNSTPYNPYKPPSIAPAPQVAPVLPVEPVVSSGAITGSVISTAPRSQGTMPESPGYKTQSYTGPTTLQM